MRIRKPHLFPRAASEIPLTTRSSKIARLSCCICCSMFSPHIHSFVVPVCKSADGRVRSNVCTRGCTVRALAACSQHDCSSSHTQTSSIHSTCSSSACRPTCSLSVVTLRILEFGPLYVSGPAAGVDRPSPGSGARARGASEKGRSSFCGIVPKTCFFNLKVFIKE